MIRDPCHERKDINEFLLKNRNSEKQGYQYFELMTSKVKMSMSIRAELS